MKRLVIATCTLLLLTACSAPADNITQNEPETPPVEEAAETVEAPKEPESTITDEDYTLYNDVLAKMQEIDPEGTMDDAELFAQIAPEYDMTAEELSAKVKEVQNAAITRSVDEHQDKASKADEVTEEYKEELKVIAHQHIEQTEMQKIKGSHDFIVKTYQYDPVKAGGVEYPYTFLVRGEYEEKGTGALQRFTMVLGTTEPEQLKDFKADLLKYQSTTGTEMAEIDQ